MVARAYCCAPQPRECWLPRAVGRRNGRNAGTENILGFPQFDLGRSEGMDIPMV